MKIHVLPVSKEFQPDEQNYRMPTHGRDWNCECDFHFWLLNRSHLITAKPEDADWDYLPMFWNRLYINWDWGQRGLDRIQNEVLRLVSRHRPTFTIVEYDVVSMQPFFDLCGMVVFTASRQRDNGSIDIPLLCSRHEVPAKLPEKRHLASFIGNLQTDGLRMEMEEALDAHIENGNKGTGYFVDLMLSSRIALAPRGHGGQSFRFYEAMDLGTVPYHIGEPDTRPFKRWVDWDSCSLYAPTVGDVNLDRDDYDLAKMGAKAKAVYHSQLRYGRWCKYVLKELE